MGFGDKLRSMTGSPSHDLMEHGILGRGQILSVTATGMSGGIGAGSQAALQKQVLELKLHVMIDNTPAFEATARTRVPGVQVGQLTQAGVTVAVRVDPNDHSKVAVDLATKPPTVTLPQTDGFSLADVLAQGTSCHVVVTDFNGAMGLRSPAGLDIYGFWVTLLEHGKPPRSVQVATAVPEDGKPLLYQGSKLPAKYVDDKVAVDWDAAIAEASEAA